MSRRGGSDYDDRRGEYISRTRSRYDERDYRDHRDYDDRDYRRPPPTRERERETIVREEVRERDRVRDGPAYLRDDYGRTEAGPMVLRKRETEEFDVVHRRPRAPSPEPEKEVKKEEIIIKTTDEHDHGRRRDRSIEREEIIIRKTDDRDDDIRSVAASRRGGDREKEEIIIRRTEEDDTRSRHGIDREKEEITIRRTETDDDRYSRRGGRSDIGRLDNRPISHERERSRVRGRESDSEEIIIRKEDRGRGDTQQEIIIRRHSRSNSPSSISTRGPPVINAPPIHQEIITHHRHIDHGFERARPISRPPTPPSPPRPRERSEERIEIRRSGERANGEHYSEDIIIDQKHDDAPRDRRRRDPIYDDYEPPRPLPGALAPYRPERERYDGSIADEAEYYNDMAMRRGYPGEAYNGATRDWGLVDVPPGTRRVRMDGQGGGGQEITWQRYSGNRRSRFYPDDRDRDGRPDYYPSEIARPEPPGTIGPQYRGRRDPTDGLWTEITKDLVVKEAIKEMGYEYEETEEFYYIFKYLGYVSCPPCF
jgi:hypothetical protein